MKAIRIEWNIDSTEDLPSLPTEMEIPKSITQNNTVIDFEVISDYISDVTGFCHNGFEIVDD